MLKTKYVASSLKECQHLVRAITALKKVLVGPYDLEVIVKTYDDVSGNETYKGWVHVEYSCGNFPWIHGERCLVSTDCGAILVGSGKYNFLIERL